MAPATAFRLPLTRSSTVSRVRPAEPTVACTVRSTASRTASGSSFGLVGRRAIGPGSVPYEPGLSCPPMALEHTRRAVHLEPAAELAERVLLPGDPRRALVVAQSLLEQPRMFNHSRGLWGYTGTAADGEPLTVQATGMGGPSAAIVCEELIALGARRLLRIGTCGALVEERSHGDLLAAETVLAEDGASRALGASEPLGGDAELTAGLVAAGASPATVVSTDLFFDPREGEAGAWLERGAVAVEMEAAAVFQVAALRGARAACVLAVTDVPADDGSARVGTEELEAIGERLGAAGYEALRSR